MRLNRRFGVAVVSAVAGGLLGVPLSASTSALADPSYSDVVLGDAPVGYWKLADTHGSLTAVDEIGAHNGVADTGDGFGGPPVVAAGGTSDRADTTHAQSTVTVPFTGSGPGTLNPTVLSVELWYRPDNGEPCFQDSSTAIVSGDSWQVACDQGLGVNALVSTDQPLPQTFNDVALTLGVAHHLVLEVDYTSHSAAFFVDGAQVQALTLNGDAPAPPDPESLFMAPPKFFGLGSSLGHVAVYDKLLSPAQVLAHYQAGAAGGSGSTYTFRLPDTFGDAQRSRVLLADPVNTATGNLVDDVVDMASPAGSVGLEVRRAYNSRDTSVGVLGTGWTAPFSQQVIDAGAGAFDVVDVDGRRARFTPDGSGGFNRPAEFPADLAVLGGGGWRLDRFDGSHWTFDTDGRLASIADAAGQTATISRDTNGNPATVTSSTGASVTLSYTTGSYSGQRLAQVATSDGRTVTYGFNPAGDLTTVTDPAGKATTYQLDSSARITTILDPTGRTLVATAYDSEGRATSQSGPSGNTTTFTYDDQARTTIIHDSVTNTQLTYAHDPDGRVIQITDPVNAVATRGYDTNGNLTATVDRLGAQLTQTFDTHGNVLTSNQPGVGTTTYTYDGSDRVLTTTVPFGATTTYTYTGSDRVPTTIADSLGHTTTQTVTNWSSPGFPDA